MRLSSASQQRLPIGLTIMSAFRMDDIMNVIGTAPWHLKNNLGYSNVLRINDCLDELQIIVGPDVELWLRALRIKGWRGLL